MISLLTLLKNKNRAKLQRFGRLVSGMVMPNISIFIAWGLLTALSTPDGWLPNASLATLAESIIVYLLPILIGYTGGRSVYAHRGGLIASIATLGMIVSTNVPMFLGAMIIGPAAAWCMKRLDHILQDHIPVGFEMLINNFSAGLLSLLFCIVAFIGIGPIMEFMAVWLGQSVNQIVGLGILPATALIIEPAKLLFLNNAINYGVISPIAIEQATQHGKSILFLLEANPGPGLGILLLYYCFGKGEVKQSVPGALIIHVFGGIHEIYFPYVLLKPKLIFAIILGGASGIFTFSLLNAGLVATPSPGSIIAITAMTPKGGLFAVFSGITVSTLVTFVTGSMLVNWSKADGKPSFEDIKIQVSEVKGNQVQIYYDQVPEQSRLSNVSHITIACDSGMGSSVMEASKLRKVMHEQCVNIEVSNSAIDQLTDSSQIVISHNTLTHRAVSQLPQVMHISIQDFLTSSIYLELSQKLKHCLQHNKHTSPKNQLDQQQGQPLGKGDSERESTQAFACVQSPCKALIQRPNILLGLKSVDKQQAIVFAGQQLVEAGYVQPEYVAGMLDRELQFSTFMGNGAAIPHGCASARQYIRKSGMSILQFPDGIDFAGNTVFLLFAIAGQEKAHLKMLARLAELIDNPKTMATLAKTTNKQQIIDSLG